MNVYQIYFPKHQHPYCIIAPEGDSLKIEAEKHYNVHHTVRCGGCRNIIISMGPYAMSICMTPIAIQVPCLVTPCLIIIRARLNLQSWKMHVIV